MRYTRPIDYKNLIDMLRFLLLFPALLLINAYSFASLSATVNAGLKKLPSASTGMMITDLTLNRVLYAKNASRYYVPASNTKLLTAITAFLRLKPDFHFTTQLAISPKTVISEQQIKGDLFLLMSGDPSLTHNDLNALFRDLAKMGVRRITGNLTIVPTLMSGPNTALGWMDQDLNYCYGAPISSYLLDQDCLYVTLNQTEKGNIASVPSYQRFFHITPEIQYVNEKDPKTCTFRPKTEPDNHIRLTGCLPNHKSWPLHLAIRDPYSYLVAQVSQDLQDNQITLTGKILTGNAPVNTKTLAAHDSPPLQNLVKTMLVYSNNIYAGALTKAIGYQVYKVGTFKAGVNAIIETTTNLAKMPSAPIRLEDGAGGSRYNLVSPEFMVKLLTAVYQDKTLYRKLYSSLAISGQTGTIAYRMNSKGVLGKVRAKTGTLQGVSALSGYAITRRKHIIAFSIMMNGLTKSDTLAHRLQDQIITQVVK